MPDPFDHFADRVEQLLDGEAASPAEAADPLLRLATNLHEALGSETMDPAFRARLKAELLEQYANNVVPFPTQAGTVSRRMHRVRQGLVAAAIACAASVALAFGIGDLRHHTAGPSTVAQVAAASATATATATPLDTATTVTLPTVTPHAVARRTAPPRRPTPHTGAPGSTITLPEPRATATKVMVAHVTRTSPSPRPTSSRARGAGHVLHPIPSATAITVANVTRATATPVPPTAVPATSTPVPTVIPANPTTVPTSVPPIPTATRIPATATKPPATNTPPPTQVPPTNTPPPTEVPATATAIPPSATEVPSATAARPTRIAAVRAPATDTSQPTATAVPATNTPEPTATTPPTATMAAATEKPSASPSNVPASATAVLPTPTASTTVKTGVETDTPVAALPSATSDPAPATPAGTEVALANPSATAPFSQPAVQSQGSPTATPLALGHDMFPAPALTSSGGAIAGTVPFSPGVLLKMAAVPASPGSLAVYRPSSDLPSPSDLLSSFGFPVTRVLGQAGTTKLAALVHAGSLAYRASLTLHNSGYGLHMNLLNPVEPRAANTVAVTAEASATTFLATHQLAAGAQLTGMQAAGNGNQYVNFTENIPYLVSGAQARVTVASTGQVLALDLSWVDTSRAALAPSVSASDALARIASGQAAIHSTGALPTTNDDVSAPSILYVPVTTAGGVYYEPLYQFSGHTFGGARFQIYVPALDPSYLTP